MCRRVASYVYLHFTLPAWPILTASLSPHGPQCVPEMLPGKIHKA